MAEGWRASRPAPRSWDLSPPGTFLPLTLRVLPAASSSHRDGSAAWEQGWLLPCPPGRGGMLGKKGLGPQSQRNPAGGCSAKPDPAPQSQNPVGTGCWGAVGAVPGSSQRGGAGSVQERPSRCRGAARPWLSLLCSTGFSPLAGTFPRTVSTAGNQFPPPTEQDGAGSHPGPMGATPVPWEPPRPPHGTGWVPAAPLAFAGCFFVPALPGAAGDPKSLPPPWPAQEGCPKPGLGWDLGVFPPSGWVRIGCNPARGGSPARGGGCLPPTSA